MDIFFLIDSDLISVKLRFFRFLMNKKSNSSIKNSGQSLFGNLFNNQPASNTNSDSDNELPDTKTASDSPGTKSSSNGFDDSLEFSDDVF